MNEVGGPDDAVSCRGSRRDPLVRSLRPDIENLAQGTIPPILNGSFPITAQQVAESKVYDLRAPFAFEGNIERVVFDID